MLKCALQSVGQQYSRIGNASDRSFDEYLFFYSRGHSTYSAN
jgi:hypothetical protein